MLREWDLNQNLLLFLGKMAFSQTQFPNFYTGLKAKLHFSEVFWKEWPLVPGPQKDRWHITHHNKYNLFTCVKNKYYLNISSHQVQEDLIEDIRKFVQKLVRDIRLSEAPEIVAFLNLLGNELGYMKASEIRKIVEMLFKSAQGFIPNLTTQVWCSPFSR